MPKSVSGKNELIKRLVWLIFLMAFIMNLSALTMTSFMITFWPCGGSQGKCVMESNPSTAHIFSTYGIPAMYLIDLSIWFWVFVIFFILSRADREMGVRYGLVIQVALLVVITPMVFSDFVANLLALSWAIS